MNYLNYGGNKIKYFDLNNHGKQNLGSGPYQYYFYNLSAGDCFEINDLSSFTIYLIGKDDTAQVTVKGLSESFNIGDCIQFEGLPSSISANGGNVSILVSGTPKSTNQLTNISFKRHQDLYKVIKPWGHELWLNGQHPDYAIKEIYIKAGTKTSLQYHNFKQETNVLFNGTAKLHYKTSPDVDNDYVTNEHTDCILINAFCSIDVVPKTLHRIEAITDILLFETSTPHLDDVVRVMDDSNRNHGRLQSEHLS